MKKNEDEILAGFKIGSVDSAWKKNQIHLKNKFKKIDSIYNVESDWHNRFKKYIILGKDSMLAEYEINEPLQFGKLRYILIKLNGVGVSKSKINLGYGPSVNFVTRKAILSLSALLNDLYGKPSNVYRKIPRGNKVHVAGDFEHTITWRNENYEINFQYNSFKPSKQDSICDKAQVIVQTNNYQKEFNEGLKLFKSKYKPTDVLEIRLADPTFEYIRDLDRTAFKLVQLYRSFTHGYLGYDNEIKAIKFDVVYKNRFKEDILVIKDVSYDFHGNFAPNLTLNFQWSNENIGFSRLVSSDETRKVERYVSNPGDKLIPSISNLKLLYASGDVFE
jgi:hypothetical protein